MEFLDDDARPRFVLQSKSIPQTQTQTQTSSSSLLSSLHKPTLFLCLPLSLLLLPLSFFTPDPLQSLLIWISLSLLLGPFAPPSLTAGDISVGQGPPINPPRPTLDDPDPNPPRKFGKRSRSAAKIEALGGVESGFEGKRENGYVLDSKKSGGVGSIEVKDVEEGKWGDGDVELLKKFLGKHPVGKPGRWEAISEGFRGRYKVESVIKKAKELGEKKGGDEDSFKKFLKDRKPVDRPVVENENDGNEGGGGDGESKGESGVVWSAGEDLALLNALKTFPKDVPMRWEKIAVAVPGKSKAACIKRVASLKKDFRSSKAGSGEN